MLLLAALNPRPAVSLRLLTSRSQALPLGIWLAAGGSAGAMLSALATALALREAGGRRRQRPDLSEDLSGEPWFRPIWPGGGNDAEPEPVTSRAAVAPDAWLQAGPQRGPGEPAPTVSVPFRVLRRPRRGAGPAGERSVADAASAAPPRSTATVTAERPPADDWDSSEQEDW